MSVDSRVVGYGKIFGEWTLHEMLGKGSNGRTAVFRVTRKNRTYQDEGAMKVVNIIEQRGSKQVLSDGFLEQYKAHCEELCKKAENELSLMSLLRGSGHIVNYHDHRFEEWEDEYGFGIDLLIRMDLLESLDKVRRRRILSEPEIIQIGIDISNALIYCHEKDILHRDIKPDNIFYNQYLYMLGDFGISKMMEEQDNAQTRTGTESYAAPEQFRGNYDHRVDIYSLGITLYELANHNKLPFANSPFVTAEAIQLRLNGKNLPKPEGVSDACADVILKACVYKPEERYQTALELRRALERLLQSPEPIPEEKPVVEGTYDPYQTVPSLSAEFVKPEPTPEPIPETKPVVEGTYDPYQTVPSLSSEFVKSEPEIAKEIAKEIVVEEPEEIEEELEDELEEIPMFVPDIDAEEMVVIGRAYYDQEDYEKAVEWYRNGVAKGNTEAMYELASCFSNGTGIEKDILVAISMFTKCAQLSEDKWIRGLAKFRLGQIYEKEFTNRRDRKMAEQWYRASASDGNPYAMKRFCNGKFIKEHK